MSLDARLRFRHEFLPSLVDPSLRLNHSTPSLHPRYRASTLLRVDPPLCHASGLLTSWGSHLGISLGIVTTGSHVPRESLNRARATFTPVTIKAVSRSRLDRIPGQRLEPGFDDVPTLSTPHRWFTHVRLLGSYLTGSDRPFPERSRPGLLIQAASGDLRSGPATRSRGTYPHLSRSMAFQDNS